MRCIGGVVLRVLGLRACPCHLIITLPGIYFVAVRAMGAWFVFGPAREKQEMDVACPTCTPAETETRVQKPSRVTETHPARRS